MKKTLMNLAVCVALGALGAADPVDAHAHYLAHRAEIEDGVEMMDDGDFNPATECSAYEHALWMLFTMKAQSFYAEMQMIPSKAQGICRIHKNNRIRPLLRTRQLLPCSLRLYLHEQAL